MLKHPIVLPGVVARALPGDCFAMDRVAVGGLRPHVEV